MAKDERIFSQQDLSNFSPWVRQQSRCHWIREHCSQRRKYAGSEIARLLREIEEPMDTATCRALADFVDPNSPSRKTGPKSDLFEKWCKYLDAATIYGETLARLGQPGGPRTVTEAKGEACNILGCSESTLGKFIEEPLDQVVEWARQGLPPEAVTEEQNAAVSRLFAEKHSKKNR